MSRDRVNNTQISFKDLQEKVESFRKKRDELNQKTKDYINNLQELESDIYNSLKNARDTYKKKREYWNSKVKLLKKKKIEYKTLLDNLTEEKIKLQRERRNSDEQLDFISIKQIDRKIENFERIIETENLNINEENEIIDKIKELADKKNKFFAEQQNDTYYKLERKIDIVKINLNKIYEQLTKWSNKSQKNHAKMLELYQKANELKDKKKKVEEELIENKKSADKFHEQFLNAVSEMKKRYKAKKPYKAKSKKGIAPSKKPKYRFSNKDRELLEKMKQDKLATALEKQKAGKKLNLFEARLILEQNKG